MDISHILLGRPWLYNQKVKHDGFLKTYTFHKDGRKITLAPLAPQNDIKPKSKETHKDGEVCLSFLEPTILVEHHEYKPLKEMILFTPTHDHTEAPTHPLALKLLQNFSYVFLDEFHLVCLLFNTILTSSLEPFFPTSPHTE